MEPPPRGADDRPDSADAGGGIAGFINLFLGGPGWYYEKYAITGDVGTGTASHDCAELRRSQERLNRSADQANWRSKAKRVAADREETPSLA